MRLLKAKKAVSNITSKKMNQRTRAQQQQAMYHRQPQLAPRNVQAQQAQQAQQTQHIKQQEAARQESIRQQESARQQQEDAARAQSQARQVSAGPQQPAQPAQPAQSTQSKPRGRPKITEPVPTSDMVLSEEHRALIERYIDTDNQIATLKAKLKELNNTKAQLEQQVTMVIKPLSVPIQTGNTVLRVKNKVTKQGISKAYFTAKLAQSGELKDPNKSKQIVDGIYGSLGVKKTEDELVRKD